MLDRTSKYGSTGNAFEVWKKHLVSMGYVKKSLNNLILLKPSLMW